MTIDVTALEIGAPRKWNPRTDRGQGGIGTIVYPVKATYTFKTFYRGRTEVSENWIDVFNFYVNSFGEWEWRGGGNVKTGDTKNIPRDQ